MKTTKKILPALAMLIVSAVMMATASFAWFAMNETVEANQMSVNIKSDSVYLLISSDKNTNTEIQEQNGISAAGVTTDPLDLFPTAHANKAGDFTSTEKTITGAELKNFSNWYTKAADDVSSSTSTKTASELTGFENYVVRYTFYLTLGAGSNDAEDLILNEFTITASDDSAATGSELTVAPFRALLISGNSYIELKNGDSVPVTVIDGDASNPAVTDDNVTQLDVYLYYDGNDSSVYTENIINLEDVDFSFKLGV